MGHVSGAVSNKNQPVDYIASSLGATIIFSYLVNCATLYVVALRDSVMRHWADFVYCFVGEFIRYEIQSSTRTLKCFSDDNDNDNEFDLH